MKLALNQTVELELKRKDVLVDKSLRIWSRLELGMTWLFVFQDLNWKPI